MKGNNVQPFIWMTFGVLGLVVFTNVFDDILDALYGVAAHTNVASFIAMETVGKISATVLYIGIIFGLSTAYRQGYKQAAVSDAGGLLRMVFGLVQVLLFATLFSTVLTNLYTLYSSGNASTFTAFTTIVSISAVPLFLAGIFSGVATGVSGYRSRRRKQLI